MWRFDREVALRFVEKYGGKVVSLRDGFVIARFVIDGRVVMVWFRSSPITYRALRLVEKLLSGYDYDKLIIVRPRPEIADKARHSLEVLSIEELEEILSRQVENKHNTN